MPAMTMKAIMFAALIACTAGAEMPQKEKEELHRAEMNYKTQMQYQGHYPKEAIALKKEYEAQVARIKKEFEAKNPKPVMFLADADSMKMKAALREAKDDYLTQMQYQGQYQKEAAELKRQYEQDVARIKSEYASQGTSLMLLGETACGNEEADLQEAKNSYKVQMEYQGAYPSEANELKEEYASQVRRIKSLYASKDCGSDAVLLAASPNCAEEAGDLHEAKQDYKIQMTFQGDYPEEAKELKQEYEQKVLKLKKQYATCHSGDAKALGLAATSNATGTNLLLLGTCAISALLGAVVTGAAMRVHKTGIHGTPLLA